MVPVFGFNRRTFLGLLSSVVDDNAEVFTPLLQLAVVVLVRLLCDSIPPNGFEVEPPFDELLVSSLSSSCISGAGILNDTSTGSESSSLNWPSISNPLLGLLGSNVITGSMGVFCAESSSCISETSFGFRVDLLVSPVFPFGSFSPREVGLPEGRDPSSSLPSGEAFFRRFLRLRFGSTSNNPGSISANTGFVLFAFSGKETSDETAGFVMVVFADFFAFFARFVGLLGANLDGRGSSDFIGGSASLSSDCN